LKPTAFILVDRARDICLLNSTAGIIFTSMVHNGTERKHPSACPQAWALRLGGLLNGYGWCWWYIFSILFQKFLGEKAFVGLHHPLNPASSNMPGLVLSYFFTY
jgi:hypothetical protein